MLYHRHVHRPTVLGFALCAAVSVAPSFETARASDTVDPARARSCAAEAVRWSLTDGNISEPILVDGTTKFHHLRVDGYARHWDQRIWAFVSAPTGNNPGALVVGYVDPANNYEPQRNDEKRAGMRTLLNRCLKGGLATNVSR